jgi:phosphate butyryltransferase
MDSIRSLNTIVDFALNTGKKRLVVAVAQDDDVLKAVKSAVDYDLVSPILVGDGYKIQALAKEAGLILTDSEIIDEPDNGLACLQAVKIVADGNADILMKGMVGTAQLAKVVLNKEFGLLTGGLLSHVAFFESPHYHKILCVTDAALNISPGFNEKVDIVKNAVSVYEKLGMSDPLVAILAPVEIINPKIESTVHASMLSAMQKQGQIPGCIIDGPFALDAAISTEAARHKGLTSEVAGNADILVVPEINSGNILYKSLNFLGGAACAAIVAGARIPVVLTSRSDHDRSKFLSIALAVAMIP